MEAVDEAHLPGDAAFREAVRSHVEFGSRVAQQNSWAKNDAELHPSGRSRAGDGRAITTPMRMIREMRVRMARPDGAVIISKPEAPDGGLVMVAGSSPEFKRWMRQRVTEWHRIRSSSIRVRSVVRD